MKTNHIVGKKSRILTLKTYLEEYADEVYPVTIQQMINHLEKEGVSASRKTIKQDIDMLLDSGVDIVHNTGHSHEYFVGERHFELAELKLLVDAVSASGFIPAKKSESFIKKLSALTSKHQAAELNRHLYVEQHNKIDSKVIYQTIDLLHKAINTDKQVTFKYFEYNQFKEKKYKHNNHTYKFSPYAMLWNRDRYYVIGYSDKHSKVVSFRVDRIEKLKISELPAVSKPQGFDIQLYTKSLFQMYGDDKISTVTLKCENSLMKHIIDRFGIDVKTAIFDDEHFTADIEVSISSTFFGWLFGFGGKMKIIAPETAVSEYKTLASKMTE